MLRDIERKLQDPPPKFKELLINTRQIYQQKKNDSSELYSIHAPEVECIAKGKAHKKYEFGCKTSIATTSKINWIVGIQASHNNPYDGATRKPAINQVQQLTGIRPKEAVVDRGYRGKHYHPPDVKVHITVQRKASGVLKKLLQRRNAIEPLISHDKHDHGLCPNHLKGKEGDRINAILSGCGYNMRKLLRAFSYALQNWLSVLVFKPLESFYRLSADFRAF